MLLFTRILFSRRRHYRNYGTANHCTRGKVLWVIDHLVFISGWMISSLVPQVEVLLTWLWSAECAHRFLGWAGPSLILRRFGILPPFQILVTLPALNHLRRRHRFEMLMCAKIVSTYPAQFLRRLWSIPCSRKTISALLCLHLGILVLLFAETRVWRGVRENSIEYDLFIESLLTFMSWRLSTLEWLPFLFARVCLVLLLLLLNNDRC